MTSTSKNGRPTHAGLMSYAYNTWRQSRDALRMALLRKVISEMGHGCLISAGCVISHPEALRLGRNVFVNRACLISAEGGISIGDECKIGPMTTIWSSNHSVEPGTPIRLQPDALAGVIIGDNVWIGAQATILAGVTIGADAVVAAGAVVTRDVAPRTLVAGVPARPVKSL